MKIAVIGIVKVGKSDVAIYSPREKCAVVMLVCVFRNREYKYLTNQTQKEFLFQLMGIFIPTRTVEFSVLIGRWDICVSDYSFKKIEITGCAVRTTSNLRRM